MVYCCSSAACKEAVTAGVFTAQELLGLFEHIDAVVESSFQTALMEPKITSVDGLVASNAAPLAVNASSSSDSKFSGVNQRPFVLQKQQIADVLGTGGIVGNYSAVNFFIKQISVW